MSAGIGAGLTGSIIAFPAHIQSQVGFAREELQRILDLYGRMVAAGECATFPRGDIDSNKNPPEPIEVIPKMNRWRTHFQAWNGLPRGTWNSARGSAQTEWMRGLDIETDISYSRG